MFSRRSESEKFVVINKPDRLSRMRKEGRSGCPKRSFKRFLWETKPRKKIQPNRAGHGKRKRIIISDSITVPNAERKRHAPQKFFTRNSNVRD
jgi:hypothetical protein